MFNIKKYQKIYYKRNKNKKLKYQRDYYKKNHEKELIKKKVYTRKNRHKIKIYHKKWYKKNRVKQLMYHLNKLKTDVNYKLIHGLRTRLNRAIKGNYKSGSAVKDLGCSIEFLKQYLESKFLPCMTWNNHGFGQNKWNIDHIIPLDSFDLTDRKQLLKAVHYTNLQPLWQSDNLSKGSKI